MTADGGHRVLHPWFASQFALGLCLLVGGFFLVPAYLNEAGFGAGEVGLTMSLMGVGALVSPVLGRLADRFALHRAVQGAGVVAMAVGSVGFAAADSLPAFGAAALVLGFSQASVMSMNGSLVMGSGAPAAVTSRSITALAATLQLGQLLGMSAVAAATGAGVAYPTIFLALAVVALLALLVTVATSGPAARRLAAAAAPAAGGPGAPVAGGIKAVLLSALGAMLLAVVLSQTGQMALETQLPGYMDEVFGVSASRLAAVLSLGSAVSLLSFVAIARWTARQGPMPAWLGAQGLRVVGPVGLVVAAGVAAGSSLNAIVPLGCYLLTYLAYPMFNAAGPAVVDRVATIGKGEAQGLYVGALALCGIVGPALGGWLAASFGAAVLPWATLVGGAAALVVTVVLVRGGMRGPVGADPEAVTGGAAATDVPR